MMEPRQAMLVLVGLSGAVFLGVRWLVARFEPKRRTNSSTSNYAYDKAKYHHETIDEFGLPDEHACHPAAFFLSWLINNKLTSRSFETDGRRELALYRAGKMSIHNLYYQRCDGCLVSDMLNDEGNAFAKAYFDFRRGYYLQDYKALHDEALSGEWKGHRSSRLSIQYRIIYRVVATDQLFQVVSVTAHDYRRP